MPDRPKNQVASEPANDASDFQLPPRFAEALAELRAVLSGCDKAGIPENTLISAIMAEAMPRLIEAYGHSGAALALDQLAREVSATGNPPSALQ
jgi:hypothetical protein|tara:strand:+ start:500 stop:781 length:282 start_codon:yes stop_codon:yes gene_type:complete